MTRCARAIALVAALGVAGLSSPLAICVAACTEPDSSEPAAHCHDASSTRTAIQADTGACSHTPVSIDGVKLARDPHSPILIARMVLVTATAPADRVLTRLLRADRRSPQRPHTSTPILRI